MDLNPRKQRFCDEYLISYNATQAAIKAGYSEKAAGAQGSRLLKDVNVRAYLGAKQREIHIENTISREEVLYHLSELAAGRVPEMKEVVVREATYIDNANNPEKKTMVYNEKVQMIPLPTRNGDRNKALELLGRHYALFTDRKELEMSGTLQIIEDVPQDD